MGDLGNGTLSDEPVEHSLTQAPVDIPPPDECRSRSNLEQGVDLPIMTRLDVRIDPQWADAGTADRAEVSG